MNPGTTPNALRLLGLLWVLWAVIPQGRAQDIHFSQHFNAPLALGPGSIGQFDGEHRFNSVFRQQWRAVTVPYRTFALGWDGRLLNELPKLAFGAWAFGDRAGDSRMTQFHLSAGASWTERWGANSLSAGVQLGFTSLTIDPGSLTFDAQYNGFYYDPQLATGESFQRDGLVHPDVHAGLMFRHAPDRRHLVQFAFSVFNLTTPEIGFLGGPGSPLDMRKTSNLLVQFPISTRFDLRPSAQHMGQGTFNEWTFGANLRYILLEKFGLERAVLLGLHGRAADAGFVHAGVQYDDWTVGVSYDINTSDLVPASRNRGGIEFAVIRILRKRPLLPVRYKACPDQL